MDKMDEWNRYLGTYVTPKQYVANGGSKETLFEDLLHLWGNPSQEGYLTKKKIRKIARRLAHQLPS
jgi:hypothetical protein